MSGNCDNRGKLSGKNKGNGLHKIDCAQTEGHEQKVSADLFDRRSFAKLLADSVHIEIHQSQDQGKDGQPQQGCIDQEEGIE